MTAPTVTQRRVVRTSRSARLRRTIAAESLWLALLVVSTMVLTWCVIAFQQSVPMTSMILPLAVGTLLLGPSRLPWFVVFVLVALSLGVWQQEAFDLRRGVTVAIIFTYGLVVLLSSFRRTRLGVSGFRGESMLVDLRDQITDQGRLPRLPDTWYAESVLRSAGGTPFAGDFTVAHLGEDGRRVDLVVVDVSGKGEDAGTRALMLSGALSGLLGALPPAYFLPSANAYLLRQNWLEGFATAVHISVDLETGAYELRTAGHPPALLLSAGSGRWTTLETDGPVLGLMPGVTYEVRRGQLQRGDTVLLYTDGLVETTQRDYSMGIDRLRGRAERLLTRGVEGTAERLVTQIGASDDDRALVLLHRR